MQLQVLYKKKDLLSIKLKKVETLVTQTDLTNCKQELKISMEEMPLIRNEYKEICFEIMRGEGDNCSAEAASSSVKEDLVLNELIAFDSRWVKVMSALKDTSEFLQNSTSANQCAPHIKVNDLPVFSGSYKDWLQFYYSFKNLIHDNPSLNNCQKFCYLKSCLKGDPFHCINFLFISNENYLTAWAELEKRYNNKRLIVQSHVQSIFNASNIYAGSSRSLRKLINHITANLEALKILNIDIDALDAFLIYIIQSKLDKTTQLEFENTLSTDVPTRAQLIEFLEKKCAVLDAMEQGKIRPNASYSLNSNNNPGY